MTTQIAKIKQTLVTELSPPFPFVYFLFAYVINGTVLRKRVYYCFKNTSLKIEVNFSAVNSILTRTFRLYERLN